MPGGKSPVSALITCEHASKRVPARWAALFAGREALLDSHRGWDPGALDLARALARRLGAPLLAGRVTRLLIDLNRSAGHPRRYSELTRELPRVERERIERMWWLPHWQAYRRLLDELPGRIVHVACHSFVPVLDGRVRNVDIGLLYDPRRLAEKRFCRSLRARLAKRQSELAVRMNEPYRGTANGIGQQHRRLYGPERLVSIELEINQRLVDAPDWSKRVSLLTEVVAGSIESLD